MKKRNNSVTMIFSMVFVVLSLCVASCSQNSPRQPTSYKTQTYYPEKWETENLPEYHAQIVQFYHDDVCDTCTFLQNSILELLSTTYAKEAEEGIILYHGILTNYAENTPIKQQFSVMEEDICSSIYIKGEYHHIELWRDLWSAAEKDLLAVEENPMFVKEQLHMKIAERIKEVKKIEKKENP